MRETWGSRIGFIATTAAFAIGLGNIWRFPYLVGENGGAAFVLVYVAFSILIGVPLLTAEISLGRKSQHTPIRGMEQLTGRTASVHNLVGWLGIVVQFLIVMYYVTIIAWVLGYLVQISTGRLTGSTQEELQAAFDRFTSTPGPMFVYLGVICVVIGLVVVSGLRHGLERMGKIAMPALLVLIVVLAFRSLTFPGAMEGVAWYLMPDFSALSRSAVLAALGQSLFSIGIGMAVAFAFGSYLDPGDGRIPGNAATVVAADTAVALLAGLMIFPALFSFGIEPDQGARLLFITMTSLFQEMPGGRFFGSLFFLLMVIAGGSSTIAAVEVLAKTLREHLPLGHAASVWGMAAFAFVTNAVVVMFQGPWAGPELFGRDPFALLDYVSGTLLLPVSAFFLALYVAVGWTFDRFREETNVGSGLVKVSGAWSPFIRFLIPLAVGVVFLAGIGVL